MAILIPVFRCRILQPSGARRKEIVPRFRGPLPPAGFFPFSQLESGLFSGVGFFASLAQW
jgi:hypothetical protein